nr:transport and Golgi organization protein 2 [Onthophagus taurus]
MCILFIYINPNPEPGQFRLIIASNRDEFYNRPSQIISKSNDVIGGRDLFEGRKGGMWLGISLKPTEQAKLRFGALLNVTGEDRKHGLKGRGFIVADYLEGVQKVDDYMRELLASEEPYNAFNFVSVELQDGESVLSHCSNVPKTFSKFTGKNIMGFGNTVPPNSPTKVIKGKEKFEEIVNTFNLTNKKGELLKELLEFLKWDYPHLPCPELEKRQPIFYKYLACVYVKAIEVNYGTRTHSIILVDNEWNTEFFEATMQDPINIENPTWVTNTINAKL